MKAASRAEADDKEKQGRQGTSGLSHGRVSSLSDRKLEPRRIGDPSYVELKRGGSAESSDV
jgi:hypothetical protein